MKLKNLLTLTTRTLDFNLVVKRPELLKKLRSLTLSLRSGMNHELTELGKEAQKRSVNCKVILAYRLRTLVGWALVTKEDSDFPFNYGESYFRGKDGYMFQVYVHPDHRRQGIATRLYKRARTLVGNEYICVRQWDDRSESFFGQFDSSRMKFL